MKVTIAIDSFKGSLSSVEAGNGVRDGILRVYPDADIVVSPVADGGEGTVDALVAGLGGIKRAAQVTGPLGRKVRSEYGIIPDTHTAVIEMAAAAGITLVGEKELNPLNTTTYGVGELIKDAIDNGCRNFIIGIGGSATNDGGTGMLSALGFSFLDKGGKPISWGAKGLENLAVISAENAMTELKDCVFNIACDVKNPLCGKDGCSAVYGPQKGADEKMVADMDKWLSEYACLAEKCGFPVDMNYPGSGAAGGLGFAFRTFLSGNLKNGIGLILEQTGIKEHIANSDIVVTGEGRIDSQTVMGKAPSGVSAIAKQFAKPVIAFSGCVSKDAGVCNEHGIDAIFPIVRGATSLEDAMNKDNACSNIRDTSEQVFRLIRKMWEL